MTGQATAMIRHKWYGNPGDHAMEVSLNSLIFHDLLGRTVDNLVWPRTSTTYRAYNGSPGCAG
jgi:hypothetical protein